MNHEQHVWKSRPEVCSVGMMVSRALRRVNVHAFGTVALDHRLTGDIAEAQRQHRLGLAVDARAVTEVARLILLDHLSDAAIGEYIARVNKSVQHLRGLLNQVRLIGVVVQVVV